MVVPALIVRSIRPDTLFIPYHYGGNEAANLLTNPVLEPMNKIPEYKVCAAALCRAAGPPEWARGKSVTMLVEAQARRRQLPIAGSTAAPVLK
jgi:assimilatory nitrate reductase catalytic subunit